MTDVNETAFTQPAFAQFLGIKMTHISLERVTAELFVKDELNNRFGIMHGGAIMAFADTLGAAATVLNLPPGKGTTTIESKTNFLAPAPVGTKILGETTPVHRGRRTMVWQTKITAESGRAVARITQTQMVLEPPGA